MDKSIILKTFNNHLVEFMDDILLIFPDESELKTANAFLLNLKKINPKSIISTWYESIGLIYYNEIMSGDFEFFENKDYKNDIGQTSKIINTVEKIKKNVKTTTDDNKEKAMKYLQNLTKLSMLYFNK
jgi:hypothetical protein